MNQALTENLVPRAMDVFIRAFCFTPTRLHPYESTRVGPVWVVRDAPRKNGDYRCEEWISHEVAPKELERIARANTRGGYRLCPILSPGQSVAEYRDAVKPLGYRFRGTEPLMVHSLKRIPRVREPVEIKRVRTPDLAEALGKATRSRPLPAELLTEDAPLRQYVGLVDGEPVGCVQSISVGEETWCSQMYVRPDFRRRGIGRSLLIRMLRDDREKGSHLAVLLASHTGAKLYPLVGYKQIGTLLLFTPVKSC